MAIARFPYPTRVTVGLLLILVFGFISGLQLLRSALAMHGVSDEVTAYENRLQKLKDALPRRGRVGFVADSKTTDDYKRYLMTYFLTQYTLSPILVVRGTEPALVVGISQGPDNGRFPPELTLLRDFGDGIRLFAGKSR